MGGEYTYSPQFHPFHSTVTPSGNYQCITSAAAEYVEEFKPSTVEVVAPFISEAAVSPAKDIPANDHSMLENRVRVPQETSDKSIDAIGGEETLIAKEFFKRLFPDGKLQPTDEADVNSRMPRPSQVSDRLRAESEIHAPANNTFTKAESYGRPNFPRLITQAKSMAKWLYASYIYPLSDYLKTKPFIMPGKSPRDVAERIADLCVFALMNNWGVSKTDYNKYDGTVNAFTRWFFEALLIHAFGECSDELLFLCLQMYNKDVMTNAGKYHPGMSLGSGMHDTSVIGGIVNAYIAFRYFVRIGFSYDKAWELLGAFQGDDGVNVVPGHPTMYTEVAKLYGHDLDIEVVGPHRGRVEFLARVYSPYVWYGSPNSCCDLPRQLGKLHRVLSSKKDVPLYAIWSKASGYLVTDPNTPIISDICHAIVGACESFQFQLPEELTTGQLAPERADVVSYWARVSIATDSVFPNENENGWMDDYCHEVLPNVDRNAISTWVAAVRSYKIISQDRKIAEEEILNLISDHPSFEANPGTPYPTGRVAHVMQVGKDVVPVTTGCLAPTEIPEKPKITNTVAAFRALEKYTLSNPWDLQPGGLKCLALVGMFGRAFCERKGRKTIIYSGSRGTTDLIAAKFFATYRCYTIFIDPGYERSEIDALKKYVTVRKTRLNVELMDELMKQASDRRNSVYWLDDAYMKFEGNTSAGDVDSWTVFNQLKIDILKKYTNKSPLKGGMIKWMESTKALDYPQGMKYFRTPGDKPFHPVNEFRGMFECELSDVVYSEAMYSDIDAELVSPAKLCDVLDFVERRLQENQILTRDDIKKMNAAKKNETTEGVQPVAAVTPTSGDGGAAL